MTETAPIVSVLDADRLKEKAGSIDRAVFHVEARIADEADNDAHVEKMGELSCADRTCSPATGVCPRPR